jgi:RNA polymerase sigma-54 factor
MLKDMFTQGVQADNGVMISNANVKDVLAGIIAQEDKNNPYTDEHLSRLLSDKGIKIARRTVLKYREQMNIPAAKYRMRAAA